MRLRNISKSGGLLVFLVATLACEKPQSQVTDSGVEEIKGPSDAGFDAGFEVDAGWIDAGPSDAGVVDAGVVDAGPSDAGPSSTDGGLADAGLPFDAGVTVAAFPEVTATEIGDFRTDAFGLTPEISVEVGTNAESLTLVAVPNLRNSQVQIQRFVNPNGASLALGEDSFTHSSRSVAGFGIQATMVPESADFQSLFVPGRYTFKVKVSKASSVFSQPVPAKNVPVRLWAFEKQKKNLATFELDINLYFTGAAGVDAAAAKTNPRIQEALVQLRQIYSQAQIQIGQVRYLDTPPGFDAVSGLLPAPGKISFADLQRQSANGPDGLNFFFVESLDVFGFGGGFSGVLGVAGGIPGPGPVIGSDRSGVVVLFDSDTWSPLSAGRQTIQDDFLGVVMAHEGGHFLGLSHTYESQGGYRDNLSDTPDQTASNADEFLMQPAATKNGGKISPLQSVTLQRNPIVKYLP